MASSSQRLPFLQQSSFYSLVSGFQAGFGADMGMEKFFDIKCRTSGLTPHCAIIVVTLRALMHHGQGTSPDSEKESEEDLMRRGCANMEAHIENAKKFGVEVVVAINKFTGDKDNLVEIVKQKAMEAGVHSAGDSFLSISFMPPDI